MLIGYASNTLPEACSRYSVTELEMTGLLVNMNLWKNLLKHGEFDAAVNHVAVAQIMKAKTEPATTRIMRLLDKLSAYSFNLCYVKGRDMILSDYLSRHRQKNLDPSQLIPISFCCLKVYRSFIDDRIGEDIFCIKTRSSAKASGEQVGEVHGANKPLDPSYKPEHQLKSKLPSVIGKSSPMKTPRKPILKMLAMMPARPTPRVLTTLKSVTIKSDDMPVPIQNPTPIGTPVSVQGGAQPKTHRKDGTPLLPPMTLPSPPQPQPLVLRRILSSIPLGENGENMDRRSALIRDHEEKRQILRDQNRKISHPPPIEGIDIGIMEGLEMLDPEIRIPTDEDFVLPFHWKVC